MSSQPPLTGDGAAVRRTWMPLWLSLLIVISAVVCFWPVTQAEFINYDDQDYVTQNPRVQSGLSWEGAAWAFRTRHASNWHPLTWLSHMLDVQLFDKRAAGPHCVNLLFHCANAVLVFWLLWRLTGAQWRSALVAALFALHPLHVESVAWVAERKDVLSTCFGLLTLLAYACYAQAEVQSSKPKFQSAGPAAPPQPADGYRVQKSKLPYVLALVFFASSLMSKPMLVTLPFVMLLLDLWPLRRLEAVGGNMSWRRVAVLAWEKAPFLALSAAACGATMWAQTSAIVPLEHLPLPERLANGLVAYAHYLGKALWPASLALPYVHQGEWPAADVAGSLLLLSALCLAAWLMRSRYPFAPVGWFWFLGTLVPVIGLVQVGNQAMADRYTYVPLIGLFIVFAWGLEVACARWRVPGRVAGLGAVIALVICGTLTTRQAGYWHDSQRLFQHSAAVTKDNFVALANVGGVLFESGRLDEAMEFYQRAHQACSRYPEAVNSIGAVLAAQNKPEAVEWFRKALELQPNHPQALFNLGNAMASQGKPREAMELFQACVQVNPENFEADNNLGNALAKLGRMDEAICAYQQALEKKPDAPLVHKNLGEMLAAKGRLAEAIAEYRQVLVYTNDAASHYSLGMILAVQARWDEAIAEYQAALRLVPSHAEADYNLGYALRVSGRLAEAQAHLEQALRLRPEFPLAHYNLACVLADQGQRAEAMSHLQEALRQKPDYPEATEKLLSLAGKPAPAN